MPLVKCPDCNREVSDKAPHCIHCGCPKPGEARKTPPAAPPPKRPKPDVVITLLGAVLLAVGLGCLVGGMPGYSGLALLGGVVAVLTGGIWSWLKRD